MQKIKLDELKKFNNEKAIAYIGFFDGIHIAHDELLKHSNNNLKKILITVDNSFENIKENKKIFLTPCEEKINVLEKYHFDSIVFLNLAKIKNHSKEEFITFLKDNNILEVVVGFDFHFGKNQEGTISLLKENFQTRVVKKILLDGEKVSSTTIKRFLTKGNIKKANKQLGYSYYIKGNVVHGLKNGRKIGFHTANIDPTNYFIPKKGIYQTLITIDNKKYQSMTNIGYRPTVVSSNVKLVIETHIFDFDEDIYFKNVKLEFLSFVREEQKFASLSKLKEQLTKDKEHILSLF